MWEEERVHDRGTLWENKREKQIIFKPSIARVLCFSSIVVRVPLGLYSQGLTLQYQQYMCSLAPTPFIRTYIKHSHELRKRGDGGMGRTHQYWGSEVRML